MDFEKIFHETPVASLQTAEAEVDESLLPDLMETPATQIASSSAPISCLLRLLILSVAVNIFTFSALQPREAALLDPLNTPYTPRLNPMTNSIIDH